MFNNQPDGIILTRAGIDDRTGPPAQKEEKEIHFELCNQAVSKILGFTPRMNRLCPGSILKNSGSKMLNQPIFLELEVDEKDDIVHSDNLVITQVNTRHVRFEGVDDEHARNDTEENNELK